MRAFLSYSLNDDALFVIPLLTKRLQAQGFIVTNGGQSASDVTSSQALSLINTSNLFIGIMTTTGLFNQRVYNEWQYCQANKIPSLLFLEDSYPIDIAPDNPNVVRFNKDNPSTAIQRIEENKQYNRKKRKETSNELTPYILGGTALTALAILLSKA